MEKIKESKISGAYEGKKQDALLRDKINEVVDWINELEGPEDGPTSIKEGCAIIAKEIEKEKENGKVELGLNSSEGELSGKTGIDSESE